MRVNSLSFQLRNDKSSKLQTYFIILPSYTLLNLKEGGGSIYISFNKNADLGAGDNSQQWSKPQKLLEKAGNTIWYPSLQPINTPEDKANKYTSLRLGKKARLFFKQMDGKSSHYLSYYLLEFDKPGNPE